MKRILKFTVLFLVIFSFFSINASASVDDEIFEDFSSLLGREELSAEQLSKESGVEALMSELISVVSEKKGKVAEFFSLVLLVSLLVSFCECSSFFENRKYSSHITAAILTVSSVVIFTSLYPLIEDVRGAIIESSGFFEALLPILTGISNAAGSTAAAGCTALNMNITLSVCSFVVSKLLLPLSILSFSLTLSDGISLGTIGSLVKTVRGIFMWGMGIVTAVIIGGVSMQSIIASATDSMSLRAAKMCTSGIIPVVGGAVSSSLSALVGGLSYLKDVVGIGAVMFILATALSPLILMLLYRLSLSVGITIMDFIGITGGVRTFSAFRSALDTLIAIIAVVNLIYILEILIFMKSGVALFG